MLKKVVLMMFLILGTSIFITEGKIKKNFLWKKITGKWYIKNNSNNFFLSDKSIKERQLNYSELTNNNSIRSYNEYTKINKIKLSWKIHYLNKNNNVLFFYGPNNFKKFYGFRFYGTNKKITSVALIKSTIKDTTKRPTEKNNFKITKLAEKNISLKYDSNNNTEIIIKNNNIVLKNNDKIILKSSIPNLPHSGYVGISHRENIIDVKTFSIFSSNKMIFNDNFSENKIYEIILKMKKVK